MTDVGKDKISSLPTP